jgi:hypothetical protein
MFVIRMYLHLLVGDLIERCLLASQGCNLLLKMLDLGVKPDVLRSFLYLWCRFELSL